MRSSRQLKLAVSAASVVLLSVIGLGPAASRARADVLHMKDGRDIEGQVLEESSDQIVIKTPFGKQTFSRSDIKSIEKKESALDAFQKKKAELKRDDLDSVLDLANWAKTNGLSKEAKDLYQLALTLDKDNEVAHKALGHVQLNGGWHTKEEADKLSDADKAAQGMVKYKGQWVTKDDKEKIDKGYKKVDGKWVSEEEENAAKGLVKENGKWVSKDEAERKRVTKRLEDYLGVTPHVYLTSRFQVAVVDEDSRAKAMADFCEQVHNNLSLFFENDPKSTFWLGRALMYVFSTRNSYQDFVSSKMFEERVGDKEMRKLALNGGGMHSDLASPPFGCSYIEKDKPFEPHLAHQVGHFCLAQYVRKPVPPWLDEGWAEYVEILKFGQSEIHCNTKTTYGDKSGEIADKSKSSKNWKDLLKQSVEEGEDTPLDHMKLLELNALDYLHLSKSWSLVNWWIETKKPQFLAFVKGLRTMDQDQAMQAAFGVPMAKMDEDWRAYVKSTY